MIAMMITAAFAAPSHRFDGAPLDTTLATDLVTRAGERYLDHALCHTGSPAVVVEGCLQVTSEATDGTVSVRRLSEHTCAMGLTTEPCFSGYALEQRTVVTTTTAASHFIATGAHSVAVPLVGMVDVLSWEIDRNLDDKAWAAVIRDADGVVVFAEDHPAPMAMGGFDCSELSDEELCTIIGSGVANVHDLVSDLAMFPVTLLFSTVTLELGPITVDMSAMADAWRDALASAGAFASWSLETHCLADPDGFRDLVCSDPAGHPGGPGGNGPTLEPNGRGPNGDSCLSEGAECVVLLGEYAVNEHYEIPNPDAGPGESDTVIVTERVCYVSYQSGTRDSSCNCSHLGEPTSDRVPCE